MRSKDKSSKDGKTTKQDKKVSNVRTADKVLAVLCSDIHLSDRAPVARSAEPNWYNAMSRPLAELKMLCAAHECPLIIAGDIFDRHGAPGKLNPSGLISYAIEHFKEFDHGVYAIPGQHDLPLHVYSDMEFSSYWVLVQAGAINDIDPRVPPYLRNWNLMLWGFPWGEKVHPMIDERNTMFGYNHIAVVHSYIWMKQFGYPGAPESARVKSWMHKLRGYDCSVFGDNHKGFKVNSQILNCGTLMRRKIDEVDYKPHVGLLHEGNRLELHYLDCSEDKFIERSVIDSFQKIDNFRPEEFIAGLGELGAAVMDFGEAVRRWLNGNDVNPLVRKVILEAMAEEYRK